jgi:peptidyl-prolyl cis-trans isomerase C
MSKSFFISLLAGILLAFNATADNDRIVAQYDGKSLHKSEVTERLKFLLGGVLPDNKKDFDDLDPNTKQTIIQEMVQQKVLEDAVNKSQIKNSKLFQQQVEEAQKKAVLDVYLQNYIKRHMNESMIKVEYNNYVNTLKDSPEVKISHILVPTEEEAKKVLTEIKEGKSFDALAKQYSTDQSTKDRGGEIGYISKGQTFPTIEKAAYNLKVGEVSEPLKTQVGWHIIKVLDIKKQQIPSYDAIKPQLEQQTAYKLINEYMQKLIQEAKVKLFINKSDDQNK